MEKQDNVVATAYSAHTYFKLSSFDSTTGF